MIVSESHVREAAEKVGALFSRTDIEAGSVVQQGSVVQTILREAGEGGYDLLVIGATERLRRLKCILGSVADEIVKNSPIRVI